MTRLKELDALRGIAALNVVLLHFHDMWLNGDVSHLSFLQVRLMTSLTPLFAGTEAVILFFLLSGFVLALPFEKGRPQSYRVFLIRRVTRIYGPYLVAILLAVGASAIWHGNLHHGHWPSNSWTGPPALSDVLAHVGFIGVYDWGKFDVAIWSLIHEMRISLIFPALWLLTRRLGTLPTLLLATAGSACAVLLARWPTTSAVWSFALTVHYAGFFAVGILLLRYFEPLRRRLKDNRIAVPVTVASLACYFGGMGLFFDRVLMRHLQPRVATICGNWIVLLGAVGIVLLAVGKPAFSKLLHARPIVFLGDISYSLYLVHFIVLMALTFAAGPLSPWIQFPLYLGLSLLLAVLFHFGVEKPFMQMGRALTTDRARVENRTLAKDRLTA